MKYRKTLTSLLLVSGIQSTLYADTVLTYELNQPDGQTVKQTISIDGRWLRLDTEPKGPSDYILMDTGRQLKFDVYEHSKSYQVTRMGRLYWPATADASPQFKPLRKAGNISGARCQQVLEVIPSGEPELQHCMSTTGPLGLNSREMITLSRLFTLSRRLNVGWPAVATKDERQVSVASRTKDGTTQRFTSVWHGNLPYTKFKIPVDYQRIHPDLPDPSVLPKLREKPVPAVKMKEKRRYNQD